MYVVEPSELSLLARGKQVLVRETNDGEVLIDYKGDALPARAFPKNGCVTQGAIVENKVLAPALREIQRQQAERASQGLSKKRMTLRDEDLLRKSLGDSGLPTRRAPGRPTIREVALARLASESPVVDGLIAETLGRLARPVDQGQSPEMSHPLLMGHVGMIGEDRQSAKRSPIYAIACRADYELRGSQVVLVGPQNPVVTAPGSRLNCRAHVHFVPKFCRGPSQVST